MVRTAIQYLRPRSENGFAILVAERGGLSIGMAVP